MYPDDPIKLWQHIHGASSHFPIALMLVSFAFDYGALVFRKPNWRTVGFWCLIVAGLVAVPTILSGFWGQLGWFGVEKNQSESILIHRNVSIFGGGIIVLLALWRGLRRDNLKGGEWIAYLVALLFATGAIGYTGWLGAYVKVGY